LVDIEDILEKAEDIFFELAFDNLSDVQKNFVLKNPNALFLEAKDGFSGEWEELLHEPVSDDEYLEVDVFLEKNGEKNRLALFLMALDLEENKECHIQWC
jgi:uncharacterized protein YciU (UPF0263 family)